MWGKGNEVSNAHSWWTEIKKNITELKNAFFSNIDYVTIWNVKQYFTFLSKKDNKYFKDNEWWINRFEEDKKNFLSRNPNLNEQSFNTLVLSIVNRKELIIHIEKENKINGSYLGDLEWYSKEVEKMYNNFFENQWNYKELLTLPRSVRIKLCTSAKINIDDIMDWEIGSLVFDFKFGKEKINSDIYLNTTAWQLLPEEVQQVIKNWVVYFRSWLLWEFFTENNKRLTIHQWTDVTISKLQSSEKALEEKNKKRSILNLPDILIDKNGREIDNLESLDTETLIRLEASYRNVNAEFAVLAFQDRLESVPKDERESTLENMLTDFDRIRGIYRVTWELDKNWKYEDRLALEILSSFWWKRWKEKAEQYWIDENKINNLNNNSITNIDMQDIIDSEITEETINNINNIRRFRPWSRESITLFKIACKIANIDKSWATNPHLHKILWNESSWIVWILNPTIKWLTPSEYKTKALSSPRNNPIGSESTASGLGQLLLSNIDKHYPSWRKWIWNPIEEAVWFIKYIKERYWDPDVAISVYWRTWSYVNSRTWKKMYKSFEEWY